MKNRRSTSPATQAFTLLEIMLVVAIIALLLGAAMFGMRGNIEAAKFVRVEQDMVSIKTQLNGYQMLAGRLPTTEQGLKALVERPTTDPVPKRWTSMFDKVPLDPWNNDYIYVQPGKHNPQSYDLVSKGPDGQENTADDLGNWQSSAK